MARTTTSAVQALLGAGGDYDTESQPDLRPFIDTADAVVGRVVICAARKGVPLTAAEAEIIERWLSAHYYGCSDQPYAQRTTLDAKGVFQGQTGKGLESTKYGQTALGLDPSGCLSAITQRRRLGLRWLGKPPSDQIPLDLRD